MPRLHDLTDRSGVGAHDTRRDCARFVATHTHHARAALVPEIVLHLAKDARGIFEAADTFVDSGLGARPYWAYAWPGGQALARYVLDHSDLVRGKRILDVGAGSAIASIAAMKAGATRARAADIDPVACAAARMNAELNGVFIDITSLDLLGAPVDCDVLIIGDLVYEPDLKTRVAALIDAAIAANVTVLYGDRTSARRPPQRFHLLEEYEAPLTPPLVEDFVERARVWRI
jgi:predicted nicotinamide N-methyase